MRVWGYAAVFALALLPGQLRAQTASLVADRIGV